jgi:two-component system, cell cycle sensor histidine kinase and response regulator CckA
VELTFSDAALRLSLANLLEGIQVIGRDWTYLYLNDAAARHGRRPGPELLGRTMMECYPGIEESDMFAALRRVMETGQPERMLNEFTFPSGEHGWFELLMEPVPDGVCILSIDTTDRRAVEAQLRQAQKLEAIGRLAGGIVHDFNNLLTVILGYAEFARDSLATGQASADLAEIQRAGERATRLTRQLLTFTRNHAPTPEVVDLKVFAADVRQMLARLLGDVRIELSTNALRPYVKADTGQLEQVLLNLAINARDAMPGGGHLRIAVEDAEAVAVGAAGRDPDAGYVAIHVEDTGTGMTPEIRAHAIEPFFTTKDPGTGTGLGLSTVHDIVRQAGGFLTIESTVGVGTTVSVYLPTVEQSPSTAVVSPSRPYSATGETVLVVERDASVRQVIRKALSDAGHMVLEAADAEAAIHLIERDWEPIQLLITDLVMGGMHGPHLAQRVIAYHPRIRVLYITGSPHSGSPGAVPASARMAVLPKPFTPSLLVESVRQLLNQDKR